MRPAPEDRSPNPEDESPGLPFFRTWRGVYWFVIVSFLAYVVLLAALPRFFA